MSLNYIPFFVLLHFTLCAGLKHRAPVFDFQPSTGEKYFAKIKENEIDVQISPEIRVIDGTGPICNYEFENYDEVSKNNESSSSVGRRDNNSHVQPPFDYRILNTATGQLELRVKPGTFLDCSQDSFKFYLRAKRCNDNSLSDRALIEIKIEDTNNHEPEFDRPNYDVIVPRNLKANQSILQLRAYDKDCGHPYGEVCHYEVTNGAQKWFQVTDSG
uniref:Cadherin domain-containing protein n=1 Tax=Romanomermis culicivorax TaxID=13658 RepID=A0A915IT11_ROMCU